MKSKRVAAAGLAVAMALVLAVPSAANVDAASVKAKKITFKNKKVTVQVGKKKTLTVKVKPKSIQKKARKKLKFKTSNKKVVKVNKKGVITGVKAGKATITAKLKVGKKTLKAKCKVTVKKAAASGKSSSGSSSSGGSSPSKGSANTGSSGSGSSGESASGTAEPVYVTMNIPYYDFYDAVAPQAEQADEYSAEPSVDAVSFATEKYGLGEDDEGNAVGKRSTSGTAKGTYNDGESVKGFYYAVKMDGETYEALKDSDLYEGDDYYFSEDDVLTETPASYLTLTYENSSYEFSDEGMATAAVEEAEIEGMSYTNSYGDYFFELNNVDTGLVNVGLGTNIDGETVTIAGELINFEDGSSFAMYRCDNDWMGTRYPFELSWNVDGGHDYRKGHNNAGSPLLYHYNMTSTKMTSVSVFTEKGVYEYTCDVDWLSYYTGENNVSVSAEDGESEITIAGIPDEWENVTVSVYYTSGSSYRSTTVYVAGSEEAGVEIGVDGTVALTEPIDSSTNGTYTILVSPSNYAPIKVVLDVPMSETQKATLQELVTEGQALLDQGVNHSLLAEHVQEANEVLEDPDAVTYSEAAELIEELSGYIEEAKAMLEE